MTKIQFPAPYEVALVEPGKRKAVPTMIENWVEIEFRDFDESEAPIVATFDRDFPKGIFEHGFEHTDHDVPYTRPKTELRVCDGRFYVPLYSYDRGIGKVGSKVLEGETVRTVSFLDTFAPIRIGADNFLEGFAEDRANVHVFGNVTGVPYNGMWIGHRFLKKIPQQLADELPREETLHGTIESRDRDIVDAVLRLPEEIIFIDGNAWVHVEEPSITATVRPHGDVIVNLWRFTNKAVRYEEDCHAFRLDRLDDCIAHIEKNFPGREIDLRFAELKVLHPEALQIEDEIQPIHGAAAKALAYTSDMHGHMTKEQARAWYRLRDEVAKYAPTEDGPEVILTVQSADRVAALLSDFNDASALNPTVKQQPFAVAAVDRWKWRPVREADAVPAVRR